MKAKLACIILVLAAIGSVLPKFATAQTVVSGPELTLAKLEMSTTPWKGEVACGYFLRSSLSGSDRINFSYFDVKGLKHDEAPSIANVKVVIDDQKSTPTATLTGNDGDSHSTWHLNISHQDANGMFKECMAGISINKM
jgi:hypothetical protein